MHTLTTFIQHSVGSSSHSNWTKERNKSTQIGREEVKLSLYAENMIVYIENPKESTQKLFKLVNESNKAAGYKINIQKLVAFLYKNSTVFEKECKNTIPFKITPPPKLIT